jgi:hypothetical protein
MNGRLALGVVWSILGVALVGEGIYEATQWSADPALGESSLRWWHSTGIIPGVLCVLFAYQLIVGARTAKYLGYFLTIVLALYVLYILAITPSEFILRPILAVQIVVLVLCVATCAFLLRSRLNQP